MPVLKTTEARDALAAPCRLDIKRDILEALSGGPMRSADLVTIALAVPGRSRSETGKAVAHNAIGELARDGLVELLPGKRVRLLGATDAPATPATAAPVPAIAIDQDEEQGEDPAIDIEADASDARLRAILFLVNDVRDHIRWRVGHLVEHGMDSRLAGEVSLVAVLVLERLIGREIGDHMCIARLAKEAIAIHENEVAGGGR
jgi:hypothetical protein